MEEEESDFESSDFWKEKHDNAVIALQRCEKSKQLLEKHNEELRRKDDELRKTCDNLTGKISLLTERCKEIDQDMENLKQSKHELYQKVAKLEGELSAEREKVKQCERVMKEKDVAIKRLGDEGKILKEAYGKTTSKTKALEEFGKELNTAKEQLESKVLHYEMKIAEKEEEIEQLEQRIKTQSEGFDELQETVGEMMVELNSLRDALEDNRYKRAEISQSLIDLRQNFTEKNEKLAEECYSQALDLEKAYSDCEAYCRKIEELESSLAETQKDSSKDIGNSNETISSIKDDELRQLNDCNLATKSRMVELEDQICSYRQEIQNLRSLIGEERSKRLELEEHFDNKEAECQLYLKKLDELKNQMTNGGDGMNQSDEMKQEEVGVLDKTKDSKEQQEAEVKEVSMNGTRNDEVAKDNCKLKQELLQLRGECAVLVGKNEELKAQNERLNNATSESKAESMALQSSIEKLKQHLLKFHENSIDAEAEKGNIERLRSQCTALKEERTELLQKVDNLKLEKDALAKDIDGIKQSMWQRKHDLTTMPRSIIEELEKTVIECRVEKESMMRKGNLF